MRIAGAILAGCVVLSACTTNDGPATTPTTYSTLGVPGEMICGFIPKAPLVAALGSSNLTTSGAGLVGRGGSRPLTDSACSVFVNGRTAKNFDLVVTGRDYDKGFVQWQLTNPDPKWTLFPAGGPAGYSVRMYQSTESGTDKREPRTGALALALYGDWYINLRIYRPGKGRDPVKDAMHLVEQVIAALQLPKQPSREYPTFTPTATPTR